MGDRWWYPRKHVTGPDGEELGYWASRWSEFKRLFIEMAWENDHSRSALILSALAIVVVLFGVKFLGWR